MDEVDFQEGRLSYLAFTIYDTLRPGYYAQVVFSDFDYSQII